MGYIKHIVAVVACVAILSIVVWFVSFQNRDTSLTLENIQAFYTEMEASNTDLGAGHEDIGKWLSFLDDHLDEAYKNTTTQISICGTEISNPKILDKEMLLRVYEKAGVGIYDFFEIDVRDVTIAPDHQRADVRFTLSAQKHDPMHGFENKNVCEAVHIWSEEKRRPQVLEFRCKERMVFTGSLLKRLNAEKSAGCEED